MEYFEECNKVYYHVKRKLLSRGGTPYIRMMGVIVVFFRGCNRRFGIFLGVVQAKSFKKTKQVFVRG